MDSDKGPHFRVPHRETEPLIIGLPSSVLGSLYIVAVFFLNKNVSNIFLNLINADIF